MVFVHVCLLSVGDSTLFLLLLLYCYIPISQESLLTCESLVCFHPDVFLDSAQGTFCAWHLCVLLGCSMAGEEGGGDRRQRVQVDDRSRGQRVQEERYREILQCADLALTNFYWFDL